jgi:HAD superfamily hydrolase (TIGR01509 family)
MASPDIAGVVFDMDGLLLDTEQLYLAAFRQTLKVLGLAQDDALFRSIVGTNHALGSQRLRDGLAGKTTLEAFNAVWDADIALRTRTSIPVKPGAAAFARHLRQIGMPYIIATSTHTERAHLHLSKAGLSPLFPQVVGGDRVSRSKPAPDIYLHAAEVLGLPAHRLAAFEDSANGVRAAHAAGMTTIQIPDVVPPDAELMALGHHIAPDLVAGAHHLGMVLDLSEERRQ